MVTNWFRALQRALLLAGGNSSTFGTYYYKNIQGQDRWTAGYSYSPSGWTYATGSSAGIHIGSGTTPATAEDYCIEDELSGVQVYITTSHTRTTDDTTGDDVYTKTALITVTNVSSEPIVVSEVALYQPIRGATAQDGTSTSSSNLITMLDRTLLDEPVTIPPSSAATISYSVTSQ